MPHRSVVLYEPVMVGDSVEFQAHVRNYAGGLIDPVESLFTVYNEAEVPVATLPSVRVSLGEYRAEWQIPMNHPYGWFSVEFYGLLSGGAVHRTRAKFQIVFVGWA